MLLLRGLYMQMGDGSYVVEAGPGRVTESKQDDDLQFIRITQLHIATDGGSPDVRMGVFGCCPVEQTGCIVTFEDFFVRPGVQFAHNADDNH